MLRAIIIDDEKKCVDALSLLIARYTPQVQVVATGDGTVSSINLIEEFKPDIIFLDLSMPEMDGFTLLRSLTYSNFKLILTTAHREHGLQAVRNKAVDYLLKPIDSDELCTAIKRIVNNEGESNDRGINYEALQKVIDKQSWHRLLNSPRTLIDALRKENFALLESYSNIPAALRNSDHHPNKQANWFMRVNQSVISKVKSLARNLRLFNHDPLTSRKSR